MRVGIGWLAVPCVVLFLALLARGAAAAPAGGGPFASPVPGSPVFVSFANVFDDSLSSTLFDIKASGTDLVYVWSLQNVSCGSLAQPQTRDTKNAYVHPSCALSQELPVRVSVLVARKSDIGADGKPVGDVAYFTYSQIARAKDGDPATAAIDPAPQLQYFGPVPLATTTSRAGSPLPTSTSGPGGGDFPTATVAAGGIALIGAGTAVYIALRPPKRYRQGSQLIKYECSLHSDLDPKRFRGGMGHANANLRMTLYNLDADGNVIPGLTSVVEDIYDFAPAGNEGLFSVLLVGVTGKVVHQRTKSAGGMSTNWYQEITQEGYYKGKAWADATLNNPPTYRGANYNCCDFAIQVCREAGGNPPTAGTVYSTPEDLVGGIVASPEGNTPPPPPTPEPAQEPTAAGRE